MSVESPHYEVLQADGPFEIRRYGAYLTANVRVSAANAAQATNAGFNPLADYIFGNNHASDRISMTAPVTAGRVCCQRIAMTAPVTAAREEEDYIVSFTMPSSYSMDDLPRPNNAAVQLEHVPSRVVAAVRFSGRINSDKASRAQSELEEWMDARGLTPDGEPMLAQYDSPWTPGFARHNEIMFTIDDQPASQV